MHNNSLFLVHSGSPYWCIDRTSGTDEYKFVLDLVYLLDKVFVEKNMDIIDTEQKDLLERYIANANGVLDEDCKKLDEYLGGFIRKNNEYKFSDYHEEV